MQRRALWRVLESASKSAVASADASCTQPSQTVYCAILFIHRHRSQIVCFCATGSGIVMQGADSAGGSLSACQDRCLAESGCVGIGFKANEQCITYYGACDDSGTNADQVDWGWHFQALTNDSAIAFTPFADPASNTCVGDCQAGHADKMQNGNCAACSPLMSDHATGLCVSRCPPGHAPDGSNDCQMCAPTNPAATTYQFGSLTSAQFDTYCSTNSIETHYSEFDSVAATLLGERGAQQEKLGTLSCTWIGASAGDDAWCNANCNHVPANCPAASCSCGSPTESPTESPIGVHHHHRRRLRLVLSFFML